MKRPWVGVFALVVALVGLCGCVDDAPAYCSTVELDIYRVEAGRYDASVPVPGVSGTSEGALVFTDDLGQMVYSFTVNGKRYKARYSMDSSRIKRHFEP